MGTQSQAKSTSQRSRRTNGSAKTGATAGLTPLPDPIFRQFVDLCPAIVYIKDAEGQHLYGNRHLLDKFGLTQEEYEGTRTGDFFPATTATAVEELDAAVLATGETQSPDGDIRSNRYPGWFYDVKFALDGPDGRIIGGLALDLKERVAAEQAVLEQIDFERLIADIAARLATTAPEELDDAIDYVLRSLGEFLAIERAFFGRFSEDRSSLTVPRVWLAPDTSPPVEDVLEVNLVEALPRAALHIAAGRIIKAEEGLAGLPAELPELRERRERDGISSTLIVPILVAGRALGFIGLDTFVQAREYSKPIVGRVRMVADILGATIVRTQTETILRESLSEVERLRSRVEAENLYLRAEIDHDRGGHRLVGESDKLERVLREARQVAATDSTVLLSGETGTGKELVARLIHETSPRSDRPLITVNCATLPTALVESELFGRERGAYTGAMTRQVGRFELADGATIFLDEIGDLPLETQVKLLRVLESGEFERLGSTKTRHVDVRVIAATNRDLLAEVTEGRFREDLYYRLNVFPLTLPPLRDREGDVRLLASAFVQELSIALDKAVEGISRASMTALESYSWPGNVRELRNVIERAMILARGPMLEVSLPGASPDTIDEPPGDRTLDAVERRHILSVLETTGWRVSGHRGAAEILGMKPTTLNSRIKKLGIRRPT